MTEPVKSYAELGRRLDAAINAHEQAQGYVATVDDYPDGVELLAGLRVELPGGLHPGREALASAIGPVVRERSGEIIQAALDHLGAEVDRLRLEVQAGASKRVVEATQAATTSAQTPPSPPPDGPAAALARGARARGKRRTGA